MSRYSESCINQTITEQPANSWDEHLWRLKSLFRSKSFKAKQCENKDGEIRETKTCISYIDPFKAATIYLIQKLLTWLQLFRVVYLAWATNFGFAARLSNSPIFTQKIFSHFATSRGLIYLVKQFQSSPHVATKPTLNSEEKQQGLPLATR